jgi:tetratricopeptide (TPR) repeat protein
MEKYSLAEESYLKVLEKDPGNSEVMLLIGNTYANRGQNDKALEWYSKIEFEKIDDPTVLYNIGSNFYNASNFKEALKYYKRAVEIKGDFLDAIYQLGLARLALGDNQGAIDAFEDYLKHDPDSQRASQVRGFIEFLKKKA